MIAASDASVSATGGMQATGPVVEQPLEHFQRVLDTNCTGAVRMVQAVVPAMLRQVGCPTATNDAAMQSTPAPPALERA